MTKILISHCWKSTNARVSTKFPSPYLRHLGVPLEGPCVELHLRRCELQVVGEEHQPQRGRVQFSLLLKHRDSADVVDLIWKRIPWWFCNSSVISWKFTNMHYFLACSLFVLVSPNKYVGNFYISVEDSTKKIVQLFWLSDCRDFSYPLRRV